jgi:PKD repeat protein
VTNANACDGTGSSEFVFVTVNPTPAANFDVDFTIGSGVYEFNNNTVNGVTYDWNFGDGSTSTEVNPTHTYTTGGNYTVVLTATNNGCSNTYEMALASVGTTELEASSCQVYPNPANESLNIQLASTFNRAIASIYSPSGQQIQQISAFQGGQSLVQISTSELTNGFYILILNVDGQAFSTPFIIRH